MPAQKPPTTHVPSDIPRTASAHPSTRAFPARRTHPHGAPYAKNRLLNGIVTLIALIFATMLCTPVCFARIESGASAQNAARVAAFSVSESSTLDETYAFAMGPGDSEPLLVSVENGSEVAVRFDITFHVCGNLPLTIEASSDSPLANDAAICSPESGTYEWSYLAAPNAGEQNLGFALSWPAEKADLSYATGSSTVQIHIVSTQVD